ncbi:TetR/AcrR family transcriptional regulator [Streptomyces radicis]|uniref:TetR/AcrR family transcriptional regulator n=1 Tax=Streptomyces radicis TaxID=1750517 RepID=A0A3A9WFD6_9ACTN|nr:TetR/AcrR family transcriptional regulator [Streptomyces radicis]RKN11013.1 TetR/AcrR family transcriptional regulator [Streptomyces radicis]RKN25276.1 TetR/AcrR family transcriptional regulator [Streptomyces radicis]
MSTPTTPTAGVRGDGNKISARGEARRARIIEVATSLLARNGSRGTSLAQIASAAGVSQTGLLHHFSTKEQLLHAVLDNRDEHENALLWRGGPDPGLGIFDVVADVVADWPKQPELVGLVAILVAENVGTDATLKDRLTAKYRETVARLEETLVSARSRGEIRADVDLHAKAIEILAFLSGLEMAWLVDSDVPAHATAIGWAAAQVEVLAIT